MIHVDPAIVPSITALAVCVFAMLGVVLFSFAPVDRRSRCEHCGASRRAACACVTASEGRPTVVRKPSNAASAQTSEYPANDLLRKATLPQCHFDLPLKPL